jgi:hypothetical protein
VELPEEIKQARASQAYWWFQCLRASDEYKICCVNDGEGELSETYKKFGNVFNYPNFDLWWMKHGRFQFIQKKKSEVKKIDEQDLRKLDLNINKLVLDVPLTLRKQTVMRQIGKILKKAYENREVDIQKASTATIKFEKSKMQMTTVERLLQIHKLRKKYPNLSLNQIGIKAGIELDIFARITNSDDMDDSVYEEVRRMTIAVSRYLKQARHLIDNAAHGIFPSIKSKNNSIDLISHIAEKLT